MSLENTPDEFNHNPSVIQSPSVIISSPRSKKKKIFFMSDNDYEANNNSNENSLFLPTKFRLAKNKKTRLKDKYKRSEERLDLLKSKLQNKNYFHYYNNLSSKYNNASNVNNNNVAAFYNEYEITPTRNFNNVQQNDRVPSLVKEYGLKKALKIKKVNIREGELILNELKEINENYSKFFHQFKSKYRIRNKLDDLYQYGKNLPKKILEYFKIIRKKIYKMVQSIYGFIIDGFNYAFDLLKDVLLSIGGLILTFFKTSYGAIVWVYNKSGEIKSVFLNCINNEPTQLEYSEDEINKKCDEYLDTATETIKVVKKSLSKNKNQMLVMDDLELNACNISDGEYSNINNFNDGYHNGNHERNINNGNNGYHESNGNNGDGYHESNGDGYHESNGNNGNNGYHESNGNNGYHGNNERIIMNNYNQGGRGVGMRKPIGYYIFRVGLWVFEKIGKFALSTICFTVKWSFRTSLFVFKNTAANLIKEGVFLVVPKNNKLMGYIVNHCQFTYDFLMQNEEYAYRLTKKTIEERKERLINGPRVKFYHKTTSTAAGSIIKYQTYFRSERGGFFGNGIYFCSNPNSTHNKANPIEKIQTLLESEVLVGKVLNSNSSQITFGDLLNKKCDTIRGRKLKDDEYVVFSQDQICNVIDYNDPIGFWGYKSGKQSSLVTGHVEKPLNQITHHENWFPFKSYGSKQYGNSSSIVVNFNGPNGQIVPYVQWNGTEKDLYKIYKKFIKGHVSFFKSKKANIIGKNLVSKGLGNPYNPLSYNLFIKLLKNKVNKICDDNNQAPSYLDDRK